MLCLKKKFQLSQCEIRRDPSYWLKEQICLYCFSMMHFIKQRNQGKGENNSNVSIKIACKDLVFKVVPSCDKNQANLTNMKGCNVDDCRKRTSRGCKEKMLELILSPGIQTQSLFGHKFKSLLWGKTKPPLKIFEVNQDLEVISNNSQRQLF